MLHTPPSFERLEIILGSPQLIIQTLTQQSSVPSSMNLALHTPMSKSAIIEHNSQKQSIPTDLSHEIYELYRLAIPTTLGYISEWIPTYISNIWLGHLPNAYLLLAGVGLLLSGLYTLVPQAVGAGDQKFHLLSLYIQRAFYITILCSIPLITLQFFISDILISIGEPSVLSPILTVSCRYLIIHVYASVILTILRRIAQNLQYQNQIMIICMICAFLSYPLNYVFIYMMMNTLMMIIMLMYYDHTNIFKLRKCSKVFRRKAIIALSSSVILHNIFMMIELIGVGIGRALSIRIGKYIGANDQSSAKLVIKAGVVVSVSISGWAMIILCAFREDIVKLFTNDESVIDITKDVMWIAILSIFFIITNHSMSGVYHALGKQKVAAWIIFVSYFGVGLVTMLIALFGFELNTSLLYGTSVIFGMLCLGNIVAVLLMQQYLSCFVHWNDVIRDAQNRLQETLTKTTNTIENYGGCSITMNNIL